MTRPSVLLFDLGNVLISIHPGAFAQSLGILTEKEQGRYRGGVVSLVRQFESGLLSTTDYLDRLSALFDGKFSREELTRSMLRVIGQPVPGMEELVRQLAGTATLGLVSNTNELHYEYCRSTFPVIDLFPRVFLSYQLKCLKPDPNYYSRVLRAFAVPPGEILFIDDLAENVDGAEQAGMQGLRFSSSHELREELARRSLLRP